MQRPASVNDKATVRLITARWLIDQAPNYALTLTYNDTVRFERVQRDLDKFHARVDRKLFGNKYNKIEAERRTWWAGCAEHLSSNIHVHLIVRVAPDKAKSIEKLWSGDRCPVWSLIAPAGSSILKPLADRDNAFQWARYMLKERKHLDHLILSRSLAAHR